MSGISVMYVNVNYYQFCAGHELSCSSSAPSDARGKCFLVSFGDDCDFYLLLSQKQNLSAWQLESCSAHQSLCKKFIME